MKLTRILAAVAVLAIVASIPALIAAYQSES